VQGGSDDLHTSFFQNIIVVINAMGQNGLDFSTIKQMMKAKKNSSEKQKRKCHVESLGVGLDGGIILTFILR
jgi:hypothetical protein